MGEGKGLGRLKGYSIVIIEHNLDVIKTVNYIVDLSPEGGDGGRRIVLGNLEEVLKVKVSYTRMYLNKYIIKSIYSCNINIYF